jgi:hypothetical protein
MATQTGYLVLADISGFTAYLAGVELDHAHEILSNLLETVANQFQRLLVISKFEGDAIFAYVPAAQVARGETLLELLESTYLAFRDRVTAMHRHTTCTCNACRGIPLLDLKFMAHYGQYIHQTIAGSHEILGSDVNLVHRLLKNGVSEATGWRAYALLSGAALQQIGANTDGYHKQNEAYEHLGEVPTYSYDLHARHTKLVEARRVYLDKKDADCEDVVELDAPPVEVWSWLNLPDRREQWMAGRRWTFDAQITGRRTEVGSHNHCAHGKDYQDQILETILDWRPFDYYTVEQFPLPFNQVLTLMYELAPLADGQRTRLTTRGRIRSKSGSAFIGKLMARTMLAGILKEMSQRLQTFMAQAPKPAALA